MKKILSVTLLTICSYASFNLQAASYDATEALSQTPYHFGGHDHALWMPGLAPNNDWVFSGGPGTFAHNISGNIDFTGNLVNQGNASLSGMIDFEFSPASSGNPKKELTNSSYGTDPGEVDTSTWSYWDMVSGTFTGTDALAGLVLEFTQRPDPGSNPNDWKGQLGIGANGKNIDLGFSSWFYWSVVSCDSADDIYAEKSSTPRCGILDLNLDSKGYGDINISLLSEVPLPAAFWLFGTAILGLIGLRGKSARLAS